MGSKACTILLLLALLLVAANGAAQAAPPAPEEASDTKLCSLDGCWPAFEVSEGGGGAAAEQRNAHRSWLVAGPMPSLSTVACPPPCKL